MISLPLSPVPLSSRWALGLSSAALHHRLSLPQPLSAPQNKLCRPFEVNPRAEDVDRRQRGTEEDAVEGAKKEQEGLPGEQEEDEQRWRGLLALSSDSPGLASSEGAFTCAPKRSTLCLPPHDHIPGCQIGRAHVDSHGCMVTWVPFDWLLNDAWRHTDYSSVSIP